MPDNRHSWLLLITTWTAIIAGATALTLAILVIDEATHGHLRGSTLGATLLAGAATTALAAVRISL